MSAFLGPIHYWLYNKILIQQEIVNEVIELGNQYQLNLLEEMDEKYGESETRDLEEVIDQRNIHAWLQNCVSMVEAKLAYSITKLVKENPDIMNQLEEIFRKKGQEKAGTEALENADEIFKAISDSLLDGMPCDHANTVLEESKDLVVWKRNNCVHKQFWTQVKGDTTNYYLLRDQFIEGFLTNTPMEYSKIDEVTSQIRRKG